VVEQSAGPRTLDSKLSAATPRCSCNLLTLTRAGPRHHSMLDGPLRVAMTCRVIKLSPVAQPPGKNHTSNTHQFSRWMELPNVIDTVNSLRAAAGARIRVTELGVTYLPSAASSLSSDASCATYP